jgi:hypothetical protein
MYAKIYMVVASINVLSNIHGFKREITELKENAKVVIVDEGDED